ncbi:MAG: polyhydroxyalkanoate depolymerase [Pseudomonadota bacterium]
MAQGMKLQLDAPLNPWSYTPVGKNLSAACEVFEGLTRRYGKPEWDIHETSIFGLKVPIEIETVRESTFCNLIRFKRDETVAGRRDDPKVLIVAPMSGHYATLLRGTVQSMIQEHDVYVTDWVDCRDIPVTEGSFDFDDFVDYLIDYIQFIGPNTHIMAVCQPAVPALVAAAVMARRGDDCQPMSLTLMGGPIDTRRNPTVVNNLAQKKSIEWFEQNVVSPVPFPNPGFMRRVYPGFMQLTGFMTMNLERHTKAHMDLFNNLVKGDCDSVNAHKKFYDEYMSVMDLPAEFYLQTVEEVFQRHSLPDRVMTHRNEPVDCGYLTRTGLLTIEGERDDICGLGQTEAAQDLCPNVPLDERYHYVQPGVGHYGVFNGTRFRTEIQPRIREFIRGIEFKRKTEHVPPGHEASTTPAGMSNGAASGITVGLPYRTLRDEREEEIDWMDTKANVAPVKAN